MCNGDLNIEGNKLSLKNNLINIQFFYKNSSSYDKAMNIIIILYHIYSTQEFDYY